jgi:hypothetical protein
MKKIAFGLLLFFSLLYFGGAGNINDPPKTLQLTVDPEDIDLGGSTNLTGHVDPSTDNVAVSFDDDKDESIDDATTDGGGDGKTVFTPQISGKHSITASADGYGDDSSDLSVHGTIIVETDPPQLFFPGDVDLKANLGGARSGETVSFQVNGAAVGQAQTDDAGDADLNYTPAQSGAYTISASADLFGEASTSLEVTGQITAAASPARIGTGSHAVITAQLNDSASDVTVTFLRNGSAVSIQTTAGGQCSIEVIGNEPGTDVYAATASHYISGTTTIDVYPSTCDCCAFCDTQIFCHICCLTDCSSEYNRDACLASCDIPE